MIRIRNAALEDAPHILGLIKELAHFENEPEAVEISLEDLRAHGFGVAPKFHCFVAEVDGEIVGMALVYPRYSTWKGPALHLEDLIVKQQYRGRGIGSKLLDEVVSFAKASDVKRLGWEVLDWNTDAIAFYESRGAKILKEWRVVQMDAQALNQYQ